MIQTVQLSDFRTAFAQCGRQSQFSYEALELLFNHFEEVENDTGEQIELDVIAICCEYTEENPRDVAEFYNIDIADVAEDNVLQTVLNFIHDATTVVGVTSSGKIVYVQC